VQPDPDRLRSVPLFSDLPEEDLQIIASWFRVEEVSEGRRMAPQDATGYQFYVIDDGTADVAHDGPRSRRWGPATTSARWPWWETVAAWPTSSLPHR
jgi:hypothetical protein